MSEGRRHKEAQPEQDPARRGFHTDLDTETLVINILSSLRLFLKLSISREGRFNFPEEPGKQAGLAGSKT